ncbi:MAG TPA: TonB-dependent receptor [Cryomorphaceae bacterium]|nr:TonB-dependent receptor [Cryomorphaceae bacterium]
MRLLLFIFILLALPTWAQVQVSGKVTDSKGETIPGVNVWIKDSFDGASTNADGHFSFQTEADDSLVLVLSSVGFHQMEVPLRETTDLSISLKTLVNELNAVSITAGTIEVNERATSVVMKPLDILTTAGSMGDITGALATLPGTATVGNDGRLFVRGGDASETAIFFDGLRVGNAYGSTTGNVPTRNRFSPVLFKGTFFSTGGYSAEFGDALSSVLSLETVDRPVRNQSDFSFMSVGASASSTFVGEKQSVTAQAGYINLAPYQSLVEQNFDWDKAPETMDGQVIYRHNLGKDGIIKGFVMGSKSELALWESPIGSDVRASRTGVENTFGFGNASYELPLNEKWLLEGGTSVSINADRYELDTATFTLDNNLLHFKQKATHYFTESFKLKMGAEVFVLDYSETMEGLNAERGFEETRSSAWTEAEWYISAHWTLRGGLRGAYFSESDASRVEPRLAAAYQPYESGTISFATGRFSQPQASSNRVMAPGIDPSTADHLQLSFQHATQKRTLRAEAYYKKYDGFATFGNQSIEAAGDGYARGFDLFYRDRSLIKNADFWLTYSYVDSKRRFNGFESQVRPNYAPQHNFSAVMKYWIADLKSQVGGTFTWNSGHPYDSPNRAGEMESLSADYASLSLNWSYLYRQNLIIHAAVSNATGRDNVFGYRYTAEPDANGFYDREPIRQAAPFFAFVGVFWTISTDKSANQLNNL